MGPLPHWYKIFACISDYSINTFSRFWGIQKGTFSKVPFCVLSFFYFPLSLIHRDIPSLVLDVYVGRADDLACILDLLNAVGAPSGNAGHGEDGGV